MGHSKLLWSALALVPHFVWAQSSVTLYGVVDVAASSYRGAGAGSRNMLTSSGNQSSRFGLRVRESLGDGLAAGLELESGINADSGTGQASNTNNQPSGNVPTTGLTFNRKSFVYLESERLGQIRLGRDYSPAFWNLFIYDPFRVGVGASAHVLHGTTSTGFRASNSVGYFSPGCSTSLCKGLFFQGMVAMGENASSGADRNNGQLLGWRLGYGGTGWSAAISTATTKNQLAGNYTQSSIAAAYHLQEHVVSAIFGENKTGNRLAALDGGNRVRFWQLGAAIKVGSQGSIPVSYMRMTRNDRSDSSSQKLAVGYQHSLSKRTALYGTYAYIKNSGSLNLSVASGSLLGPIPVVGGNASGFDLGIRHAF